jgi:hypothetical protein
MPQPKPVKGPPANLLAGQAHPKAADLGTSTSLVFCFDHFSPDQGQGFEEWETDQLLSKMLARFKAHSNKPFLQCFSTAFKRYACFPPKSEFKHPRTVPEDAVWASMHIQGKECVIGHMFKNVFYVVFLDRHHKFYPTDIQERGR